jgi:hypothetical protein
MDALAYVKSLEARTKPAANTPSPISQAPLTPSPERLAWLEANAANRAKRAEYYARRQKESNEAFAKYFPDLVGKPSDPCEGSLTNEQKCARKCPGVKCGWSRWFSGGRRTRKQNHRNKNKTRKQSRRRHRRDF